MPLKLYLDHHVARAITLGLRLRQVDVITAYEDQTQEIADADLLDRATHLGAFLWHSRYGSRIGSNTAGYFSS